jgi:uncharacterized protein YuzE
MKVKFDKEVDVLYIKLNDLPIVESDQEKPGIILDYAEDGTVVSIEILNASRKLQQPDKIEYEIAS